MNSGNTLTHNGEQYNYLKQRDNILIWIGTDERICLVTNSSNYVLFEIEAKTILSSGFIRVV